MKHFHAWLMARLSGRYERLVEDRKRRLLGAIEGDVLEIGPGTGANLRYFSRRARWTGVESNPFMHSYLRRTAASLSLPAGLHLCGGEKLPASNASADAVVGTLVLCSVADPEAVLREIVRVLKPGGRFFFVEHVAAPAGTPLRVMQRLVRPLWRALADGCCIDRDTAALLERAGFHKVFHEEFRLPLGLIAPHIAGFAVK